MDDKSKYFDLWRSLPVDVDANLRFARLVAQMEPHNTHFFFGKYSHDIVRYIVLSLYPALVSKSNKDEDAVAKKIMDLFADYYMFVAKPFSTAGLPQWRQLLSYKGLNNQKLKTWITSNAYREFVRKKAKDDDSTKNQSELVDFIDYEALLFVGDSKPDLSDDDIIIRDKLKKAWEMLNEKDKTVLHVTVVQDLSWEDEYEELREFIPTRGHIDDVHKQKAISRLKCAAIRHLKANCDKL